MCRRTWEDQRTAGGRDLQLEVVEPKYLRRLQAKNGEMNMNV